MILVGAVKGEVCMAVMRRIMETILLVGQFNHHGERITESGTFVGKSRNCMSEGGFRG